MKIENLQNYDLTALEVCQKRTYVLISVVTEENNVYSCRFSNSTDKPVEFKINWLDMHMMYDDDRDFPTFGELENIYIEGNVYTIEGDFGWIEIKSDKYLIWELL